MTTKELQGLELFRMDELRVDGARAEVEASCQDVVGCDRGDTSCDPNACGFWMPDDWC